MKTTTIGRGLGFLEGPVQTSDGRLIATSIDQGRVYVADSGDVRVLAETGGGPNGAAEGRDGSLYVAQNGGRPPAKPQAGVTGGVQVVSADGTVTWLTQDPVSPNDLCFGPDGALYVTDPTRPRDKHDGRLWRVDPATGEAELLRSLDWYPNGIGFGLEDDLLVVAATDRREVLAFPLQGGRLGDPEVLIRMEYGYPDGFAFDIHGNLIVAAVSLDGRPGQIQTWSNGGVLLDVFEPGPSPFYTNVALSPDGDLLIADSSAGQLLLVSDWPAAGMQLHPFRSGES